MTWKRILLPALLGVLLLALLIPELRREEPPAGPGAPSGSDPEVRGLPERPTEAAGECVILVREREGSLCRATVFAAGLAGRPPERADFIGRTGADGRRARIALPPFADRLRAITSNLRCEARAEIPGEATKIDLRLSRLPDHEVLLVLLDPDGRPLAGREVECDHAFFTTGALLQRRARTDEAGRLVLLLPEGRTGCIADFRTEPPDIMV